MLCMSEKKKTLNVINFKGISIYWKEYQKHQTLERIG